MLYQESSAFQAQAAAADPENKLLWRFDRHRVEGETIRDSMLFVSGLLNSKMGGPGINPPLPPGAGGGGRAGGVAEESPVRPVARAGHTPETRRLSTDGADGNRRSVYVFLKRNAVYPMLESFDAPNPQESCSRRFRSVIPVAVVDPDERPAGAGMVAGAGRPSLNDGGLSLDQQVDRAYRLALSRQPSADERSAVLDFLRQAGDPARRTAGTQRKASRTGGTAVRNGPGARRGLRGLLSHAAELE